MKRVPVNKIIPFSSVDGPGNRTAVFLQGCNFDCRYCHNPETRNVCRDCGECVKSCPSGALKLGESRVVFEPAACVSCDACIHICRYGCSPRIRNMTPEEVMEAVQKQVPFIRGITVSGGECTLYPEFLTDLFVLCKKEGLGTLIDSNGTLDFSEYPELTAVIDGVMLDIKAWDDEEHKKVTGVSGVVVRKNALELASAGKLLEVRTVVAPGLFDCEETVRETARQLRPYLAYGNIRYKLIRYRKIGVREQYAVVCRSPSEEMMERLADIVRSEGLDDVIVI